MALFVAELCSSAKCFAFPMKVNRRESRRQPKGAKHFCRCSQFFPFVMFVLKESNSF
jgi:hypothetical protein